ncbi:hypothetical protein DFO62_12760 [Serratia fonticola]|nr:hypothetical protein DFO62_12760 [Serratia fonticola]
MTRDMVDTRDDKTLSQGTIFNCAYSKNYPYQEILGLVISARCDIANQRKVKFYNYIPAIPFEQWRDKESWELLKDQTYNSINKSVNELIIKSKFSIHNLTVYGYDRILEIIKKENRLKPKEIDRLIDLKMKLDLLCSHRKYECIAKEFPRELSKIVDDIIKNKSSDYFFIDNLEGYGALIVNLREIRELDLNVAKGLPNGINIDEIESYPGLNPNVKNKFCSIVGQLKSPYIELLMQRFSNNFTRIGVNDPHESLLTLVMEIA